VSGPLDQDVRTLDPDAVAALCDLLDGDEEALAELAQAMLDEAPHRLAELHGDAPGAARAAHTLKSNALTFGAVELAGRCRALEAAARRDEADGELVAGIEEEWPRVRAAIAALAGGGPS
jgi:HPt (histidine-containing phosphotransfer) domain-containing protein